MPVLTDLYSASKAFTPSFSSNQISIKVKFGKYTGDGAGMIYLQEDVDWLVEFTIQNNWAVWRALPTSTCGNRWTLLYNKNEYIEDISGDIELDTAGIFINDKLVYSFLPNNGQVSTESGTSVYIYRDDDILMLSSIYINVPVGHQYRICPSNNPSCNGPCYETYIGNKLKAIFGISGDLASDDWKIVVFDEDNSEIWSHNLTMEEVQIEDGDLHYTNSGREIIEGPIVPQHPGFGTPDRMYSAHFFNGQLWCCLIGYYSHLISGPYRLRFGSSSNASQTSCSSEIFLPGRITLGIRGIAQLT